MYTTDYGEQDKYWVREAIESYIEDVVCCVGDFEGNTVHTFVMFAHFADVRTLHLMMLHCG